MAGCPYASASASPSAQSVGAKAAQMKFSTDEELAFLRELHQGLSLERRLIGCRESIKSGRPAPLNAQELAWAGRVAWRNHARCIGRLYWKSLVVRDHRHLNTPEAVFESLCSHMKLAYNGGRIRPVMTVFAPATKKSVHPLRIWNHQLCGYAAYRQADGRLLGDPKNEAFTEKALKLGWQPPSPRGAFDLLPWIISGSDGVPVIFPLAREIIPEVEIEHPDFAWFAELGMRWYALPVISDMCFHAAATDYTAAPFNGWYMGTEVGARDLSDHDRYNYLPAIAERMGLDQADAASLWKDRALVELNRAVLYSFQKAGVRMVDHHTASEEFMRFCQNEKKQQREVSAQWSWIVPPMAPATTPQYSMPMKRLKRTPDFFGQPRPY